MPRNAALFAIAILVSLGCGAAPVAPVVPVRPTGPTPSALHASPALFVRIDLASLEASLSSTELEVIDRVVARALGLGEDRADLVEHLDAIAASAAVLEDELSAQRWRVAMRHRLPEQQARLSFERALLDTSGPLTWHEQQGITSTRIVVAANADADSLTWSDPHEVFVMPDAERAEVVRVLRDHAARRIATETIEPALRFERDVIAEIHASEAPSAMQGMSGADATGFSAVLYRTIDGVRLAARMQFESEEAARTTADMFRPMIESLSQSPFVGALGLDGLFDNLTITTERSVVRLETRTTWDELRVLLRLFAHDI